ncbi:hypothetical protein VP01_177g4 [Puccinia sorghi]|uniref:Uncharacterized protein n=1 Tax=Puccinia sorghi TaxID=27349 RepID=A0A0L6VGH7_9BASI|nr:hypothetical protein VP01_177g4 [Puccinia sorghi]
MSIVKLYIQICKKTLSHEKFFPGWGLLHHYDFLRKNKLEYSPSHSVGIFVKAPYPSILSPLSVSVFFCAPKFFFFLASWIGVVGVFHYLSWKMVQNTYRPIIVNELKTDLLGNILHCQKKYLGSFHPTKGSPESNTGAHSQNDCTRLIQNMKFHEIILQPSCHPNSTCLVGSLWEKGGNNTKSFVGLSACQLQAVEKGFFFQSNKKELANWGNLASNIKKAPFSFGIEILIPDGTILFWHNLGKFHENTCKILIGRDNWSRYSSLKRHIILVISPCHKNMTFSPCSLVHLNNFHGTSPASPARYWKHFQGNEIKPSLVNPGISGGSDWFCQQEGWCLIIILSRYAHPINTMFNLFLIIFKKIGILMNQHMFPPANRKTNMLKLILVNIRCTMTAPKNLHMQTCGVWMATWLEHAAFQLQAVEQFFFAVLAGLSCDISFLCAFLSLSLSLLLVFISCFSLLLYSLNLIIITQHLNIVNSTLSPLLISSISLSSIYLSIFSLSHSSPVLDQYVCQPLHDPTLVGLNLFLFSFNQFSYFQFNLFFIKKNTLGIVLNQSISTDLTSPSPRMSLNKLGSLEGQPSSLTNSAPLPSDTCSPYFIFMPYSCFHQTPPSDGTLNPTGSMPPHTCFLCEIPLIFLFSSVIFFFLVQPPYILKTIQTKSTSSNHTKKSFYHWIYKAS